jgi:hypothetical protein
MSIMDTLYLELIPKFELAAVEFLDSNTGENMLYLNLGDPSAEKVAMEVTRGDTKGRFLGVDSFLGFRCGR